MRVLNLLYGVAAFGQMAVAASPCSMRMHHLTVNQHRSESIQRYVNLGHQPWRLDASAVAGEQVLLLEKIPKGSKSVNDLQSEIIQQGEDRTIFQFPSERQKGMIYRVTVRRFDWLLNLAKKREFMIWVASDVEVIICPPGSQPGP